MVFIKEIKNITGFLILRTYQKFSFIMCFVLFCAPCWIQTNNLLIRSQVFYSIELTEQFGSHFNKFIQMHTLYNLAKSKSGQLNTSFARAEGLEPPT